MIAEKISIIHPIANKNIFNIIKKTNFDEMTNKKIYFKRAKEMLCYEQSICMSKDTKYFIISFKTQIKALYKKMDGKIDETSDILNDFNMKTFFGETSRTIELAWNKMNDKVICLSSDCLLKANLIG